MRLLLHGILTAAAFCTTSIASAGFRSAGPAPKPGTPVFVGPAESGTSRSPVSIEPVSSAGIGWDLRDARDQIRSARDSGLITRREARQFRREVDVIERHAQVYGGDGLSESEQAELNARTLYLKGLANAPNRPR